MAVRALVAVEVPFVVYNLAPGPDVPEVDRFLEPWIRTEMQFETTLFWTTGFETARIAATLGPDVFQATRNIGFWPWELPEWPKQWVHDFGLVDEIWASSQFTCAAYAQNFPGNTRHMPMAVSSEGTTGLSREELGLPDDLFLFVFTFDALSTFTRKNLIAAIRAFKIAFPHRNRRVGLVIKAMRAKASDEKWRQVIDAAHGDPRIFILNRTMTRGQILDLYRLCDCFVSLHRSEGFGRAIADAMLVGSPVICTGFSGSMDFTTSETAALVDYKPLVLGANDYNYGEGMIWADPDIGHAAWWMRRIIENCEIRRGFAKKGKQLIEERYSPREVGLRYAEALQLPIPS